MAKLFDIFSDKKSEPEKKQTIVVDNREKNSLVVSELVKNGFQITFKQLPVADYLINNIAVERKTISDFKASIVNKRIMQQLIELKQYPNHFLILEGLEHTNPYGGGLHENAFRGFLLSTALQYKTPVIFTLNEKDTAKYLSVLAKKQKKSEKSMRVSKQSLDHKQRLQFILQGFQGIGPVAAKKLLSRYKTLAAIANTSLKDLEKTIGKKAEALHQILHQEY